MPTYKVTVWHTAHYDMPQDTTQHWGHSAKHQIAPEQSQVPPRPYLCQGTAPDALPPNSHPLRQGRMSLLQAPLGKKIQITPIPCKMMGRGSKLQLSPHTQPQHTQFLHG